MTARRHTVTVLLLLATVTAAACLAAVLGGRARDLSNAATFLVATVAGVACILRGVRGADGSRRSWILLGLGALSYAAGEAAWSWFETVRRVEPPFPSVPDIAYLGMVPLVVAGLLVVPLGGQSAASRFRSIIDGLMIAVSLLLVSWIFLLHPLVQEGRHTTAVLAVVLAYPISDLVLITVVLYTVAMRRRGGQGSRPLVMVGAAIAVLGVSDSAWAYVQLHSVYRSGGLLDVGWIAGFALLLIAARMPGTPPAPVRDTPDDRRPFAALLPYAMVVGALLISLVRNAGDDGSDAFGTWTRTGLILLIIARQVLTLLENRHLTRDLEDRVRRRTADLYAREQRFRALVRHSSDSVAIIEADSTIRYQSESVERIFGYPASVLVGLRLTEVAGRRAAPRIAAALAEVTAAPHGTTTVVEVLLRHADGRLRQAEMTMTNLLGDPSVRGLVLNTRDVHDAKELQDQLVHDAYHDGLTGLASRALFRETLQGALAAGRRAGVAVLLLDLDGFKEVNDSLGHAVGDQLLVQVAERLRDTVRAGDTVARFGGDEFAVLVESAGEGDEAGPVADRIVAAVGRPYAVDGRVLHVGASIGIATAADAGDLEQLERNADLAMYRAKAAGGNGVARYDPRMHDQLVARLALEADLRRAVERDELVLHYQPTVRLDTGEIAGFEALVRWRHPVRGLVPPLEFIAVAEATGLIVPLGRWVLTEACRQAVAWGGGLRMAVNVSVRQFHHGDLAATVAEVLAATGMPADRLCLEMTESVLLCDTDENLGELVRLKALGVTLAMDDFGTGYSSLAYLRRFPMDVLKIDRSFVDRLGGDREDEALVRTIADLGRSLGMATVAEGVEDARQWAALQAIGCDLAQGYLLSRPLPSAEATELLGTGLPGRASAAV